MSRKDISTWNNIRYQMFRRGENRCEEKRSASGVLSADWYGDLQKLTDEELMRMYTMLADGRYRFAKNAWYIPIGADQRCPIMVAKGFRSPETLERMMEFQDTANALETEFRRFIDAWDFGYITERDIENAVLKILESRNIAITEKIGCGVV